MRLRGYVTRRILEAVLIVFVIIILTFVIIHLAPGDPAQFLAGGFSYSTSGGISPEMVELVKKRYGLDKPLEEQLAIYLWRVLQGDLGISYYRRGTVLTNIVDRIPATLLLVLTGEIPAIAIGTLLGAYSAKKFASKTDAVLTILSSTLYSLPTFWVGLMLMVVFAFQLRWLPSSGMSTIGMPREGFTFILDTLQHLFLPALTLFIACLPLFVRMSRASVVEVMREDFITTARAGGLSENAVFYKHALRNALLPIITQAGLLLGFALTGVVLIETVFAWPGMGKLMFDAINQRDYPLVMGIFLFSSISVVIVTLVTDLVYVFLDPRVTYD